MPAHPRESRVALLLTVPLHIRWLAARPALVRSRLLASGRPLSCRTYLSWLPTVTPIGRLCAAPCLPLLRQKASGQCHRLDRVVFKATRTHLTYHAHAPLATHHGDICARAPVGMIVHVWSAPSSMPI
jgi:hypothetical protein